MATDLERLAISIEANTSAYERAMKRVEKTTNAAFKGGAGNVVRLNTGMNQATASASRLQTALARTGVQAKALSGTVSTFGRGLAGGIVGALGVTALTSFSGAIAKVKDTLAEFEQIGKSARTTGLTTDFYQALSFAALETGVSQEKLNAGLLIFAKNVGLAADGSGSLVTGLKKINPELLKAIQSAESQEERLRLVAEAMRQLGNATQQVALATTVFGRGGAEFTEFLRGGAESIDKMVRRGRELGIIITPEMIANGEKLDDQLEALAFVIDQNLSVALIHLAKPLAVASTALANFSKEIRDTVDAIAQGDIEKFMRAQGAAEWEIAGVTGFVKSLRGAVDTMKDADAHLKELVHTLSTSPEARNLFTDEQFEQLHRIRDLLSKGTVDAAVEAGAALENLANENPRFQDLADKLKPLIDALLKAKETAEGLGVTLTRIPGPSVSDRARKAGAEDVVRTGEAAGKAFSEAAKEGLLELISVAEGTGAGSRGFNETLGFGVLTGDQNLTAMTMREILALQKEMLANPLNAELFGDPSSALGKYQIVMTTLLGLMEKLNISQDELFSPELQTQFAEELIKQRGRDVGELRKEWEGLKRVGADEILLAFDVSGANMSDATGEAALQARQAAVAAMQQQGAASQSLVASQAQELEQAQLIADAQKLGTFERERALRMYEAINERIAAGLPLTDEAIAKIEEEATAYGHLAVQKEESALASDALIAKQEELAAAQEQFQAAVGGAFSSSIKGFISDLIHGKNATEALKNALASLADRLLDLALDSLFSGFGSMFNFGGGGGGSVIPGLMAPATAGRALAAPSIMSPTAATGRGAQTAVYIVVEEGSLFRPTVAAVAGNVSAQQIRQSESGLPRRLQQRQTRGLN